MIIFLGCSKTKNEGIDYPVMLIRVWGSPRCVRGGCCWHSTRSLGGDLGKHHWGGGVPILFTTVISGIKGSHCPGGGLISIDGATQGQ